MVKYKTETAWFSRLIQLPARKRRRSILTTLEPAQGHWEHHLTSVSMTTWVNWYPVPKDKLCCSNKWWCWYRWPECLTQWQIFYT